MAPLVSGFRECTWLPFYFDVLRFALGVTTRYHLRLLERWIVQMPFCNTGIEGAAVLGIHVRAQRDPPWKIRIGEGEAPECDSVRVTERK